jgi:hypothetical protein
LAPKACYADSFTSVKTPDIWQIVWILHSENVFPHKPYGEAVLMSQLGQPVYSPVFTICEVFLVPKIHPENLSSSCLPNEATRPQLIAGFPPRRTGFEPGSIYMEFVMDKEALGVGFLGVLLFPL